MTHSKKRKQSKLVMVCVFPLRNKSVTNCNIRYLFSRKQSLLFRSALPFFSFLANNLCFYFIRLCHEVVIINPFCSSFMYAWHTPNNIYPWIISWMFKSVSELEEKTENGKEIKGKHFFSLLVLQHKICRSSWRVTIFSNFYRQTERHFFVAFRWWWRRWLYKKNLFRWFPV